MECLLSRVLFHLQASRLAAKPSQTHCRNENSPAHDGIILVLRVVGAGVPQQLRFLRGQCEHCWLETVAQQPLCVTALTNADPVTAAAVGIQH
eukprot:3070942-Amphidinium_carterae.1